MEDLGLLCCLVVVVASGVSIFSMGQQRSSQPGLCRTIRRILTGCAPDRALLLSELQHSPLYTDRRKKQKSSDKVSSLRFIRQV